MGQYHQARVDDAVEMLLFAARVMPEDDDKDIPAEFQEDPF